ncbi:hypothetical protein N7486_002549 [Penicillium sp. IBT 16267x]|nr:hypothetical protein N7486_002549 [Penicillium sp. IBT 16267x]
MCDAKMDFEHFFDLCGRSLFAEEHKGDLDAAWDYLQSVQYDTLKLNDRAEYLRSSSIYAILVGNFANAYEHLSSIHDLLPQLSPEWGLRYTNYKVLADYTRRFPPALRFYHERGWPRDIVMISDIIGPSDISERFLTNVQKYMPTGLPRDQGLSYILNAVQWVPLHIRDLTAELHPLAPSHGRHKPGSNTASYIAQRAASLLKVRAVAEANGAVSIAAYLTRLVVEMYVASKSDEMGIMLDDLYQRCEKVDDYGGMANAKLMEGDSILCAPFTSPLAMNLIVIDASGAIGNSELWDPIERDLEFDYSAEVKQCYESALELFVKGSCKRGQAMVLLWQGSCLHYAARFNRSVNKQHLDILGEAEIKMQEARELFGRDEANAQLVKVHQILLSISKGNTARVKTAAREIGTWCAGAKNEILAHFIGRFLSRFGNEEWSKYSNLDTAMQAWECAYEVLEPIGDILPLFQSVTSRASVQQEWFNAAAARLLIEEALAMVDEVREYFRAKISSAPETQFGKLDWRSLVMNKGDLFWTFTRYVGKVFFRDEDLNPFHEWRARYNDWLESDDDFRAWREIIESSEDRLHDMKVELALMKGNFPNIWQKALMDDEAEVRYRSAEVGFRRLLDEGDILGAEALFRRYLDETEHQEKGRTRDLYRVLACHRIGDRVKAKEVLDSITDDELFEGHLEAFRQGIAILSSFSTIAQNALTFSMLGCDLDRGRRVIQLIIKMKPMFFDSVLDNALDHSIRIAHYAAFMKHLQPEVSFTRLLRAREMIETRRKQTSDLDARVWSSTASYNIEVYLDLARICLTAESSPLPLSVLSGYELDQFEGMSWKDHALLFVEMSRARAVLDSLQTQSTQNLGLSGAPKAANLSEVVHKRRLLRSLLSLKTLTPDQEKEATQLQEEIKGLEEDGTLSSATSFIETVNSTIEPKLLYQSIDRDAVIIEATFGNQGLVAFAVTNDGIQNTYQSSTRYVDIRNPVMRAMQIMREMNGYIGEQGENNKRTLNELCNQVSEVLLVPFTDIIRTKSHVIFSVSDPLTAFPFSVLPFDNEPLIKQAVVSQVPSLSVLYYLSQRKSASALPTVSVLAKAPTEEPYSTTRGGEEVNLHMAGIEAVNIARMFATWPIEASHLSRKDFQNYIEGGSLIMHIGTHGDINPRNPLLSSISIGQGQEFRVVDMSAIRSNVNLLVFAACLSGFGKATIGSEVLGFSHVVLSTGCQAYIGSLWRVSDFGSMLIMTLFYRHLKENPQWAVAEAMRRAQLDLLQLDTEKAGLLLDQMLENWASSDVAGQSPAGFVPDAEFLLLTLKMILDQLDWLSPFYWAPFILVGYGGLRFVHEPESDQIRDQSI